MKISMLLALFLITIAAVGLMYLVLLELKAISRSLREIGETAEPEATEAPAAVHPVSHSPDSQRAAHEAQTVIVEQKQPDGRWDRIGDFQIGNEANPKSWPKRATSELATPNRRLVFPSGKVMETAE